MEAKPAEKQIVKHRIVMPIQTRGGIGKSTEAIARCHWMTCREVNWTGYDLDPHNRTLSNTYTTRVNFAESAVEPEGQIITILRKVRDADVTVIDPRAHMNDVILRALEITGYASRAASAGIRITVLLFPMDEVSDIDDITRTVDALGNSVDWVVVRNRGKVAATKFFDDSSLEQELIGYGAAFLEIPALLSDTRNHIRAHEIDMGRSLQPGEILGNSKLKIHFMHKVVFENWLISTLFPRFDAIASHLLPTESAAKVPALSMGHVKATRKRGERINTKGLL